jgi:hypothetical protein
VPRRPPAPAQDASSVAPKPSTGEVWYEGIEDDLWAEQLASIIQRHAERSGGRLPALGTQAYSRNPWAPDVLEQSGPEARARRRAGWRWMSGGLPVSVAGESRPDR